MNVYRPNQVFFKDITLILINLLLILKIYKTHLSEYFWRVHAIICSIQNETETPDNWPKRMINDLGYLYMH